MPADPERFQQLTFERFKDLARDETLTRHEKIGFPDGYRAGKMDAILGDVASKLRNLGGQGRLVVDIGPGCGEVALGLIALCRARGHRLVLIDSPEMLALLPDESFVTKVPGRFPEDCAAALRAYEGRVDALLVYSVLHYVFAEGHVFSFLDSALAMLAEGGEMLLGDVPNISKRDRFFRSAGGIRFHRESTGRNDDPPVAARALQPGLIDDAVLVGLLLRGRSAGFDAYLLPQAADLPMQNRREDLLFRRP